MKKKIVLLGLMFTAVMFAASGCQQNQQIAQGTRISDSQLVSIHYLAGKLGLIVASQSRDKIVLSNENNTVEIHSRMNQIYVNGSYAGAVGRIKVIDNMYHLPQSCEQLIADKLIEKATPQIIVPAPKQPQNLYSKRLDGRRIVIDAGHGGKDPGAISTHGFYEKTVNLDVALQLKDMLSKRGGNVIMTRQNDTFIELLDRCAISNRNSADIFVSIHADSCSTNSTNGFTVYVSRAASYSAKKLAKCIDSQMVKTGIKSRGMRYADYKVVKYTQAPAVLVEMGYLSNYWEAKQLKNKDMQLKIATAIADGITNYFNGN